METVREKIEADARERLAGLTGLAPAQELSRYRSFLKVELHRLRLWHGAGDGGLEVCRARAALMDALLRHLWETAHARLNAEHRALVRRWPLALVALGGYGRAELNPHSDIDLLFLHTGQMGGDGQPREALEALLHGVLYRLWDLGLKVGHAVRTLDDCVRFAQQDMQSKTALIEARFLAGDEALFARLEKTLQARCVRGHETEYLAARLADQAARRERFGNSAFLQEPNIKNGCGGLRDFHNLLWMARVRYGARGLGDLRRQDWLQEREQRPLEQAYDFLLRVRTELHYQAGRAVDVLSKNLQPAVAWGLGFRERSPSRRIETFMREVYRHLRTIYFLTRTLEERMALQPASPRRALGRWWRERVRARAATVVDGFQPVDGQLRAVSPRVFRDAPSRLMRVFLYAQRHGLSLHPDLAQMVRAHLALVDRQFVRDPHVHATFLEILNQRGSVGRILRAMHEVDLLGKYLPEFGRLTCLVQHEFYHQYTADEHTLVCLEELDRIWGVTTPPHSQYAPLWQQIERPFVLYLALLLHDAAKPLGRGGHADRGGRMAAQVARRLGLDDATTRTLQRLIEHHLLMARISQQRDLDDPAVIRAFARQVETPELLTLLTVHTFVDAQATSSQFWNGFKDLLLWTLYRKTLAWLSGSDEYQRTAEKQREQLRAKVRERQPAHIRDDEVEAHFATLPLRYFQIHTAPEVVTDLELVNDFLRLQIGEEENALAPVVAWQDEPDRGYAVVKVVTWDRAGLFNKITGCLSAGGLNILGAQIFTRQDGIVLDTFYVADARTGGRVERAQRERCEQLLQLELAGKGPDLRPLIARHRHWRPRYQAYAGERLPTRITFDNETSETRTVIDIETEDRVGLLYEISCQLAALRLDISAAKICTEKGAAVDSFYVSEPDGGKVVDPQRQHLIEERLRTALSALHAAG